MSYNGWTNKETWLVNLWLGDCFQADTEMGEEVTAEYIESCVSEMASAAGESDMAGLITDLLNSAIAKVNWQEIASHYQEKG